MSLSTALKTQVQRDIPEPCGSVITIAVQTREPVRVEHHRFVHSPIRIGRDPDNDLVLPDPSVSAAHAELRDTSEGLCLVDLESSEGTWIGSMRVPSTGVLIATPRLDIHVGPFQLHIERPSPLTDDTEDPMLVQPSHTTTLLRALQQISADSPDASPWSALMQARGETDHERSLALFRSALQRFPGDPNLLAGLTGRLCKRPSARNVDEAQHILKDLIRREPPVFYVPLIRHDLAILLMFSGDTPAAASTLHDVWRQIAQEGNLADIAFELTFIAFTTGLLERLRERDDAPALALLKATPAMSAPPDANRSSVHDLTAIIRRLLRRLDAPSHRLYEFLLQALRGERSFTSIETLEPRFGTIPAADMSTFDVTLLLAEETAP